MIVAILAGLIKGITGLFGGSDSGQSAEELQLAEQNKKAEELQEEILSQMDKNAGSDTESSKNKTKTQADQAGISVDNVMDSSQASIS